MNQAEKKPRLRREIWLQQALEALAEDPTHLRIDELAARLGVSKGSFYWHFRNRSEFVQAMANYWRDTDTKAVADAVAEVEGSAADRLYTVMEYLVENRAAKYDLAVRAWARHEPSIRDVIKDVDEIRFSTLNGIFVDMGFDETEAAMRARVFVICHSFEDALSVQLSRKEALAQLKSRHAFFTRRESRAYNRDQ